MAVALEQCLLSMRMYVVMVVAVVAVHIFVSCLYVVLRAVICLPRLHNAADAHAPVKRLVRGCA